MTAFEWDLSDRFRSNHGAGPYSARILSVANGVATMERWRNSPEKTVRFELPLDYLLSERCGWKRNP
jgi:hypothetical protein